MIDTVILSLPREQVRDVNLNGSPGWDMQSHSKAYTKYVKNPSKRHLDSGLYFPRLTGDKRPDGTFAGPREVKIEFSVPKLLYQNNLDELGESDFEKVITTLGNRLERMDTIINLQHLRDAKVRAVHYSKNIELKDGFTSQYVLRELGKINLNKHFDLSRARFTNDGECLYFYTVAHSFVLYDKVADLNKGSKRAIDKEQPPQQMSMFKVLRKEKEILRLEVRLSQKRKMSTLFKKLGFKENPTFQEVFSKTISKKVVGHYWDTMVAGYSTALFVPSFEPKDVLKQVLLARRKAKGKTAIYFTGLLLLGRDANGLRELRSMLKKTCDDRTWFRLAADIREIQSDLGKIRLRSWFEQVQKGLSDYKPIHIDLG